jgi:very-short-patch-repair endonuclease
VRGPFAFSVGGGLVDAMSKKPVNQAHLLLEKHLTELKLYFLAEHPFHTTRKWRLDYYLPDKGIAIEIEGGIWSRGRHTRGKGFQADLDKYNHATMLGYRLLRFSSEDVLRGRAKAFLAEWTGGK